MWFFFLPTTTRYKLYVSAKLLNEELTEIRLWLKAINISLKRLIRWYLKIRVLLKNTYVWKLRMNLLQKLKRRNFMIDCNLPGGLTHNIHPWGAKGVGIPIKAKIKVKVKDVYCNKTGIIHTITEKAETHFGLFASWNINTLVTENELILVTTRLVQVQARRRNAHWKGRHNRLKLH